MAMGFVKPLAMEIGGGVGDDGGYGTGGGDAFGSGSNFCQLQLWVLPSCLVHKFLLFCHWRPEMEAWRRVKKNLLKRFFPLPPPAPCPFAPEIGGLDLEQQHQQPAQPVVAVGVASQNLDWQVLVIGFCFASAVAIALQSLQTPAPLPITFQLLCLAMACAVSTLFVAKNIGSRHPDLARVLQHVGVLFGVTAFFLAVTVSSPLCFKLIFWTIYALSLLVIVLCNRFFLGTSLQ
ncbi:hypothetical protein F0562_023522 [Nyssa sinensis]|uniref:Uncharacterized protein n=1 Tax=Nyssa sinensis TaxID=561372 RepID=A0A5J5BKW2_9ASTE|nr:hypothetical protein F0562_023522 [Nyssa sinensis]